MLKRLEVVFCYEGIVGGVNRGRKAEERLCVRVGVSFLASALE